MVAGRTKAVTKHLGSKRNDKRATLAKTSTRDQTDSPYRGRPQSPASRSSTGTKKTRSQTRDEPKTRAAPKKSQEDSVLDRKSTTTRKGYLTQAALKDSLEVATKKYEVTARKLAASERHTKQLEKGLKQKIEELEKEMKYIKGRSLEEDELDSIGAASTHRAAGRRYHSRTSQQSTVVRKLRISRDRCEIMLETMEEKTLASTEMLDANSFFLNMDDCLSGADVIGMADMLNANIFQGAAFIVDSLESSRWVPRTNEEVMEFERVREDAVGILGQDLFNALDAKWNDGDDSDLRHRLLQIALQVCMVHFCAKIIQSWSHKEEEDTVLANAYTRICNREKQAVAGRWRALTRATTKETFEPRVVLTDLVHRIISILVAVSCWDDHMDNKRFFNMFHESLEKVVEKASQIRNAIGEKITSVDISASIFAPGITFDSATMDDAYRGDWEASICSKGSDVVAGTTEIGLSIASKKGQRWNGESRVLIKPKVVLHSVLEEEE
ncbi:hypothetical protein Hypma_012277 [Hypsizygus marmoreus]|uniref:Uncharacterized protein n=1 Tax=Hypsizygus marmoreus TaxID=39966 RepID=A0A369JJ21_HYPMA|nr:hypothetical protein Hypma_012277 [Hypsizygus marmoreus]